MSEENVHEQSLAFVADWQKRSKAQQKKHHMVLIAALIIALGICAMLFVWYRTANYNRIVNLNQRYIQDSALQEADKVERQLNENVKIIKKYSRQYVKLKNEHPETTIEDRLSMLWDGTLFNRIAYIDTAGNDISLEGECYVGDRDYFKKAMTGVHGIEMLPESRITHTPVLVFYYPVIEDGEVTGVMAGFYERDRIDDLLSYQFLNFEPTTYLLQRSGAVVGSSKGEIITENMLERLSKKTFSGDLDYDDIIEVIEDRERTSVTFTFIDNKKTSVGVISQFDNSEWMILSVLPHSVTSDMIGKANDVGNTMMVIIGATFIMLIGLFVVFIVRQDNRLDKEMSNATESLRKTSAHDVRQTKIAESLGNTYSSIYYIDMLSRSYERIAERDNSIMALPDKGGWQSGLEEYLSKFVDPQYHDEMAMFGKLEELEDMLDDNDRIFLEYQRIDKSWRKAYMLPVERDENGRVISGVFAVQKIEAEKKKELETQRALKEAYEAAQLASKAKTTFLSNMSHDIRTPMNAIVGMTAIAAANIKNTDKVSDCLKKIAGSSKHLLGLINEVLDMSKIESGKVDLSEENFSISDLIDELITMNQPLIKEKGHTLLVKVNSLTHEKVIGDSTRLQQVFTNLLTNAIKYTPNGGKIEIIITEKSTNKPTIGWYEVKFIDNGIGMSESFRQNIFDPFTRADDERLATIQGTGLGMPIARNIVRMMNGDITVESEINKGSTFTVSFALKLQNDESVDYESFVDLPILVVDDDEASCESTCLMLNSLHMNSEYVTSGREAVTKTVDRHKQNDDYYALIIDWKMPGMNGIETTKAIRKEVGKDVPIIVISSFDWSDIEQEAKEAGVNAFLSKPLFKSRVVDLFAEFTGHKEREAEKTPQIKNRDFTGKRILLAEDNELNSEIAVEILEMNGLEVETAENGKICVEKFEASAKGYYDLIFMDIQMPVMNGYDAAKAIRQLKHPDAKRIPIVAMTANAFSTDVRAAYDAGMNGHISKPIEIANVIKALDENLR